MARHRLAEASTRADATEFALAIGARPGETAWVGGLINGNFRPAVARWRDVESRWAPDMPLTVLPLTTGRLADLDSVFQARGCSVAKSCYCMYYRVCGKPTDLKAGETRASRNRIAMTRLAELAKSDTPPGLLGYKHGKPVGWVSLGPRTDFVRLANSPTMRSIDDKPVWSIICFVVPTEHRKQGVAHELLAAAVEFARARGATVLEAYPVDRDAPDAPNASWFGSSSMFAKAGFVEVARHKPTRPIVRLTVTRGSRKGV